MHERRVQRVMNDREVKNSKAAQGLTGSSKFADFNQQVDDVLFVSCGTSLVLSESQSFLHNDSLGVAWY